jgi:hypothetical protein
MVMNELTIDKGWLSGAAGAYVLLNSITALRIAARAPGGAVAAGFNVDALVQGNWVTIAEFDDEKSALARLAGVLKEMKNLFRYGN